jgi:hypothetical protein
MFALHDAMNALAADFSSETAKQIPARASVRRSAISHVESAKRNLAAAAADSTQDHDRVDLAFASLELRSICESRRRATNQLGAEAAYELTQRLADISASATAFELASLFPDDIVDRSPSERAFRLERYDLVFQAGHVDVPILGDGSTDWTKVSRLRIIALEARHA